MPTVNWTVLFGLPITVGILLYVACTIANFNMIMIWYTEIEKFEMLPDKVKLLSVVRIKALLSDAVLSGQSDVRY